MQYSRNSLDAVRLAASRCSAPRRQVHIAPHTRTTTHTLRGTIGGGARSWRSRCDLLERSFSLDREEIRDARERVFDPPSGLSRGGSV